MPYTPHISHHGATNGVTGSCHELHIDNDNSLLIDCGLFQGAEVSGQGATAEQLTIDFPVESVRALVVTHVHIDHVGRIPYLLAAGFRGPIYCSVPSAELLPLVLEDAVKIGFTRDEYLVRRFINHVKRQIVAIPYKQWQSLSVSGQVSCDIKLQTAGHILGSAYVEVRLRGVDMNRGEHRVLFSGDLGAPYAPLLPAPQLPYRTDTLVLESTYGDRQHPNRRERRLCLQRVIERALADRGVVLIPAFSIGRTQELLYELESLIHQHRQRFVTRHLPWDELEIIVDSPLASRFTDVYRTLKPYWDREAQRRVRFGRHPLSFEQLTTIDSHQDHENAVAYLAKTAHPCIVLAASGMCAGGRIMRYLKALLGDSRHDIVFVGYQAQGTPGQIIQKYGPRGGYVDIDGERYDIRARVHTLAGYSAHADQQDLLRFVRRMRFSPMDIRLVHGDTEAKYALKRQLEDWAVASDRPVQVSIPC